MTQEAHTPENWYVDGNLEIRAPDIFDDGTNAEPWVVAQVAMGCGYPDCQDKANARRIVACVNALAGIPIEAIESGVVVELKRAATAAHDWLVCDDAEYGPAEKRLLEVIERNLGNALAKMEAI